MRGMVRHNESENPIGIETAVQDAENATDALSHNESENPIGIETR